MGAPGRYDPNEEAITVRTVFRATIADAERKALLERIGAAIGGSSDDVGLEVTRRREIAPAVATVAHWIRANYAAPGRRPPDGIAAGFGDDRLDAWVYFFAWLITAPKESLNYWDKENRVAIAQAWS